MSNINITVSQLFLNITPPYTLTSLHLSSPYAFSLTPLSPLPPKVLLLVCSVVLQCVGSSVPSDQAVHSGPVDQWSGVSEVPRPYGLAQYSHHPSHLHPLPHPPTSKSALAPSSSCSNATALSLSSYGGQNGGWREGEGDGHTPNCSCRESGHNT